MKYTDLDLNGKTVLITGGAGFIGSNLALHIQQEYPACRTVVFDAFALGHFKNLRGYQGECLYGDVAIREDLNRLARYRFDCIFHQAAITDTTQANHEAMLRANTNSFQDILDLAARNSASVVYASSGATYGKAPAPNRVGAGEAPENVYGFSKLMMDHLAREFVKETGLPVVGLRYFNAYGAREEHKGAMSSMIYQLAGQMLSGKKPRLFKWGEQQRDFVYVEDIVQANLKALTPKQSGVYNVGTGAARSFNDLIAILSKELGIEAAVEYFENPWSFYQDHTEADISATREMLAYEPRFSLEEGIRAYAPDIRRLFPQGIMP